jgi:hypothetical protein
VRHGLQALVDRDEIAKDATRTSGYRLVDRLLAAWVRAGRREDPSSG